MVHAVGPHQHAFAAAAGQPGTQPGRDVIHVSKVDDRPVLFIERQSDRRRLPEQYRAEPEIADEPPAQPSLGDRLVGLLRGNGFQGGQVCLGVGLDRVARFRRRLPAEF